MLLFSYCCSSLGGIILVRLPVRWPGVLYGISPPLLVFLAVYAASGTAVMTRYFGRVLTALNAACLRCEGWGKNYPSTPIALPCSQPALP